MYAVEQMVLIWVAFTKYASWTKCWQVFCKKCHVAGVLCKTTIYKTVEKFRTACWLLNKRKIKKKSL